MNLWVPSQDLETFNDAIQGTIEVLKVYIGSKYDKSESSIIEKIVEEIDKQYEN